MELDYLFEAHFPDELIYQQTIEDVSVDAPGRSACYDLCLHDDNGNSVLDALGRVIFRDDILFFGLYSIVPKAVRTIVVDLRDGHFEINGVPFSPQPHWAKGAIPAGGKYRLIYYLDNEQDIIKLSNGSQRLGEHRRAYRLGWEYKVTVDGHEETFTQTVVVQ